MACTDIRPSRLAKLYVSATALDTGDTPSDITWTEVGEALSTDRSDEIAMIELNAREYTITANCPGRRTVSIAAPIDWKPGGTGWGILHTAYTTKAKIALADMDQDITTTGARGAVGNFYVQSFPAAAANDDSKIESALTFVLAEDVDLFFDYTVAAS